MFQDPHVKFACVTKFKSNQYPEKNLDGLLSFEFTSRSSAGTLP